MTIKHFCGTMIVVAVCLGMLPILPQKRGGTARVAAVRKPAVASATVPAVSAAVAARGRVQRAVPAKVQVGQAAAGAVGPTASIAAVATPVAQPAVTPTTVAVTPAVAGGPTVVSPVAVTPAATDENKKKVWLEMQDSLNILLGAQVFFHPTIAPYNDAPMVDDVWTSADARASFTFSVAAKQDAVIQLVGETVRTITLGANSNTNFIVRVGDINATGATVPVTQGMKILDGETTYTPLWVSYNKTNGELKIGKGVFDTNVLMTWIDPTPLKSATIKLGLGGWSNVAGSKVFYNNIYVISPTGAFVLATHQAVPAVAVPAAPAVAVASVAPVAVAPVVSAAPVVPAVQAVAAPVVAAAPAVVATQTAPVAAPVVTAAPATLATKLPAARAATRATPATRAAAARRTR